MTGPANEASAARAAASYKLSKEDGPIPEQSAASRRQSYQAAATAFVVLFCIVGVALWGLPFYYDFMVQQFGWTRAQVTSGNALSKLVVGPIFGFLRRMGRGPLWSPPHDDGRHSDGRGSPGRTGLDLKPRHVLLFLLFQRPGLCLWRPTAQPSFVDRMVRSIARKSDGFRLPRNRHRGSNRPVDIARAGSAFRMAGGSTIVGHFDRGCLTPLGVSS